MTLSNFRKQIVENGHIGKSDTTLWALTSMLCLSHDNEVARCAWQLRAFAPNHAYLYHRQGTSHVAALDPIAFQRPRAVNKIG
jgi:hypothetical protein